MMRAAAPSIAEPGRTRSGRSLRRVWVSFAAAFSGMSNVTGSAHRCPPPGRHPLDLDLEREAEDRTNQHDQPEDRNILQGWCDRNGPDKVCGN